MILCFGKEELSREDKRKRGRFHFEEAWCEDEECEDMFNKLWIKHNCNIVGVLKDSLMNCGKGLKIWN